MRSNDKVAFLLENTICIIEDYILNMIYTFLSLRKILDELKNVRWQDK